MKKHIISFLLILCMLLGMAVLPAHAASSGTCGANLTWTLDDNGILTISGTGDMYNYIGFSPWYTAQLSIKSVIIQKGVTGIGNSAFNYCDDITSVIIPEGVTSIGNKAFSCCVNLTSINIPNSITTIGDEAFYVCKNLRSITIPEGAITAGNKAFCGCQSLTSITIPNSLTTIGTDAFADCGRLTSIIVNEDNPNYSSLEGNLYDKNKTVLIQYSVGKANTSFVIPDSVKSICSWAFATCSSLTSITIPDGVTSIGYEAFHGCRKLTSITIPDSVTSIGDGAFYVCSKLKDVYYNGTPEQWNGISIGSDNNSLTSAKLHITRTVTYTGDYTGTDNADYLTTVTFPTAPYGYTYTFKVDGKVWDGIVKGDTTVVVTKTINNYTVTYTGDYEGTDNADYLTTVTFPTAPYGYTYTFKVDGKVWDGIVKGDTTVVVTKTINNYTVTYTGDYTGTDNADYLTTVTFPTAPYGYTYSFKVDGSVWDGIVKGDTTVVVTKTINSYTINYTGEYIETLKADYMTALPMPEPPYGYTYSFIANGKAWDGIVTADTTVAVAKTPINYTVTYTGEYEGTDNAAYLTKVTFPTAPYGYTYTFKVDGSVWDGIVKGDTTVAVTKTPINYTVTYTGDYNETLTADYLTELTLPTAPENYIYRFTVNGSAWDGVVRGDTTVLVSKLCDLSELDIENLMETQKDGNSICGKFYGKYFVPQAAVSENASYSLYSDSNCTQTLSNITLAQGENAFYIKVTAESGRQTVYTLTIDRDIPENIGTLTVVQAVGNSMIFSLDKQILGNPVIKVVYGKDQSNFNYEKTATINPESGNLYIQGLPEGEDFYFKAIAVYDDIRIDSTIVAATTARTLSGENHVLRMISPSGGSIDHENGTISDLRVMNSFAKIAVDVEVSPRATWNLYYTATSNTTYANKEVHLTEGRTKTAYIRVKAEDGTEKTYSIGIYRQTKSQMPQISVSGNVATITSMDGKNIYYTTDGTEPNEITGILYSEPFAVTEDMTIKAIAKQDNKDEYSNIAEFKVPKNDNVAITPIDVYYDGTNINYEFFVESNKSIYGIIMLAVYDSYGKMTTLFEADGISGETEKLIDGSFPVADKDYSTCKAMLWNSYNGMKPLTSAVLIEK